MNTPWRDAEGWLCIVDDAGRAWRWDAIAGWERFTKYDLPDKEVQR